MASAASATDRRREPRIPLGLPVVVRTESSAVAGRTVDVSLGGVQVEMLGALPAAGRRVVLELGLSGREPAGVSAVVVRRALTVHGRELLALRIVPGDPPGPVYRGRPLATRTPVARASPDGSPQSQVAMRQLRALGARLLELALEDGDGAPPPALVTWVGRLAGELGVDAPRDVSTNRALFRGIASMHRGVVTRTGGGVRST